jgi:hypothetical protein
LDFQDFTAGQKSFEPRSTSAAQKVFSLKLPENVRGYIGLEVCEIQTA